MIAAYESPIYNGLEKPFANGISAYKLFFLFVIGGVLGFVFESIWCPLTTGHFEVRTGLVIGTFIPVYGLGAVALTVCLHRLYKSRDLLIFLSSAIIGGGVEYLTSLFQQLLFGTISWDYSNTQFNFGGRTNLTYSFVWGILGIVWVKDWYPAASKLIERIPKKIGKLVARVLLIALVLDILLSAAAVTRETERHESKPATNSFEVFLDQHFSDAYLDFVFPNMKYTK